MSVNYDPENALRRSQLYRWHRSRHAKFVERGDSVFVELYSDSCEESVAAQRMGICDLSLLSRVGLMDAGSAAWLTKNHYQLPDQSNTSVSQPNGDLLIRLSTHEFVCLQLSDILSSDLRAQMTRPSVQDEQLVVVPRAESHSLFAVSGDFASAMFAKLCGVDVRPHNFANGSVAQTSVARLDAIVVRHDLGITSNFFLLSATSAAEYLWGCLLDAMDEFDGKPIGISALRTIGNNNSVGHPS